MKNLFSLLLLLSFSGFAQKNKPVQTIGELTDSLQKIMAKERMPGLMLTIATRDSVLFVGGLGYADVQKKQAVTPTTLFRIGSITKTFTSLGILKLIAQNKIQLGNELKSIISEVPIQNDWHNKYPVRVVHLLEHTAGFDDMHLNVIYNLTPTDPRGLDVAKVFKKSLVCRWKPGERMAYSNPGYAVAGYLLEKISGKPYEQFLYENVLQPIGMTHSNLNLRPDKKSVYAQGYNWKGSDYEPVTLLPIYAGAAGTMNACAEDMAKYVQFYLNNFKVNGQKILPESALDEMEKVHSTLAAKAGIKNGYGLANTTKGHGGKALFRGHNGGIDGFISAFGYNRELGVGYALSNNGGQGVDKLEELIQQFLTQQLPVPSPVSMTLDTKAIEPFLGYYALGSPRNELLAFMERLLDGKNIKSTNNTLTISNIFGSETDTLVQTAPLTFRKKNFNVATYAFVKNSEGTTVLVQEGKYFEPASLGITWLKISLLILAVLCMVGSLVVGAIGLIFAVRRSITRNDAWVRLLPAMATLSLLFSLILLGNLEENLPKTATINSYTVSIFATTALFAVFTLVGFYRLNRQYSSYESAWLRGFLLVTYGLMSCLSVYLYTNGWIGIQLWDL
ncbi:MAG: class A beta-lactamase-related serine hydrolase [Cytophagia bacterium]|nr:MAG: class A beta-lactamase-related serine hydrolase [Runella sp.]TAG18853.1 MAG: class A beta-lactamase-related serine hydrolase [Cytophagales bacterium]TAG41174.1 MAG: class A beta-lactamase-related serine hydrolase [Cytophagia bacterium]TAG51118.1 MAG: class A beta-lactamase-related serine hydrolase [Runella slithyformis]TAG74394.1 MAG: class A beta-lactamase-related serine hydrolase [Runella slithyformis]